MLWISGNSEKNIMQRLIRAKQVTTFHGYLRNKTAINSDKGLTDDGKN